MRGSPQSSRMQKQGYTVSPGHHLPTLYSQYWDGSFSWFELEWTKLWDRVRFRIFKATSHWIEFQETQNPSSRLFVCFMVGWALWPKRIHYLFYLLQASNTRLCSFFKLTMLIVWQNYFSFFFFCQSLGSLLGNFQYKHLREIPVLGLGIWEI